jgi:hypothetical protein
MTSTRIWIVVAIAVVLTAIVMWINPFGYFGLADIAAGLTRRWGFGGAQ